MSDETNRTEEKSSLPVFSLLMSTVSSMLASVSFLVVAADFFSSPGPVLNELYAWWSDWTNAVFYASGLDVLFTQVLRIELDSTSRLYVTSALILLAYVISRLLLFAPRVPVREVGEAMSGLANLIGRFFLALGRFLGELIVGFAKVIVAPALLSAMAVGTTMPLHDRVYAAFGIEYMFMSIAAVVFATILLYMLGLQKLLTSG
jgi:hypothetical protein